MKWKYGTAGDIWKVKNGDIWKVGEHILCCGDIENGYHNHLFDNFGIPDLTYVDPPWNISNIKSFFTKAELPSSHIIFSNFLDSLIHIVKKTKNVVYIEMGKQNINYLVNLIKNNDGRVLNVWNTTYYKKHPCYLVRATWSDFFEPSVISMSGLDDRDTPQNAIIGDSKIGDLIFDACCGRGLTGKVSHNLNRKFMGIELNPRRLAVLIEWLNNQGEQPEYLYNIGDEFKNEYNR